MLPDFKEKYDRLVEKHKSILIHYGEIPDFSEKEKAFFEAIELLKSIPHVDSEHLVNKYLKEGKTILAEGAQGTMLDVDFGSYPFVTSSNTTTAGACTGLGVAPNKHRRSNWYWFSKLTAHAWEADLFQPNWKMKPEKNCAKIGHEFGATTGRPRRTGWIDLPALKYAILLNGVTAIGDDES